MKLYTITDTEGTILAWAGTQVDARHAAKDMEGDCQEFDVPTNKEDLLEFVNKYVLGVNAETGERVVYDNKEETEEEEAEGVYVDEELTARVEELETWKAEAEDTINGLTENNEAMQAAIATLNNKVAPLVDAKVTISGKAPEVSVNGLRKAIIKNSDEKLTRKPAPIALVGSARRAGKR
jgi:uncharacterized coiled-coil protein SlyX